MDTTILDLTSRDFCRQHLIAGWLAISAFVVLGIALEVLHALKAGYLLDVDNDARRLMWSLAHAHGTLLGLLNVAASYSAERITSWNDTRMFLASRSLLVATLFIPIGFLLGGIDAQAGDPGLGILLVPPGGLLLLAAVVLMARATIARA